MSIQFGNADTLPGNKAKYAAVFSDIIMTCGHFRSWVIGPFLAEHGPRGALPPMCYALQIFMQCGVATQRNRGPIVSSDSQLFEIFTELAPQGHTTVTPNHCNMIILIRATH